MARPPITPRYARAASPARSWLKIGVVVLLAIIVLKTLSWLARPDRPSPTQASARTAIAEPERANPDASAPVGQPASAAGKAPSAADRTPPGVATAPEAMDADACTSFGATLHLPDDTQIIAVAASGGRKAGFRIDHGEEATQVDVAVNSPDHPAVLMVSGKTPTIWNIGLTPGTRVLAVLASGKHRQAIAGLDPDTPIMASTGEDSLQCGYFSIEHADIQSVNPIALHVFQRPADRVYLGSGDSVVAGNPIPNGTFLARSPQTAPEIFRDDSAPPSDVAPDESVH